MRKKAGVLEKMGSIQVYTDSLVESAIYIQINVIQKSKDSGQAKKNLSFHLPASHIHPHELCSSTATAALGVNVTFNTFVKFSCLKTDHFP